MTRRLYEKITSPDALLALLSGVLLSLSFPKPSLSGLAYVALVPLLFALMRPTRRLPAFVCGMLTGLVFYLGTIYWLTLTMENYGGIPRWLSLLILFALSCYLALFHGIFAWGTARMHRARLPLVIGAPLLWVALEYARAHLLTGFPWALLGYTQYRHPLVLQVSDITGVYGVSFLIVMVQVAFAGVLGVVMRRGDARAVLLPAGAAIACLVVTLAYGAYRLDQIRALEPSTLLRVGVVQGNIEQEEKWDPIFRDEILAIHTRLSREAAQEAPDLIIWPEASVPFYFLAERAYQSRLLTLIDDLGIALLFGSPDTRIHDGKQHFYNSAFLVAPGGELQGRYDKMHLVPFGEYVPLRRALFFVHPIIDWIGDMTPGRDVSVMKAGNGTLGTPICYEIILPHLVRRFVAAGANVVATLTNDDWFGRSAAPYQHFSMAVLRAVENRVPVVRSANTGISGVIVPDGTIVKQTEMFVEDVFVAHLPLLPTQPSFYTRFGDLFAWICAAGAALCLMWSWMPGR